MRHLMDLDRSPFGQPGAPACTVVEAVPADGAVSRLGVKRFKVDVAPTR